MSKTKLNWQKIYLNYSPKLLGICRRYVQDIQAAEDVVHDSFIVAIQKNGQLKDEKAVFSWLKTIVVNNALQYLRKQSKDVFITDEITEIPDNYAEMEQNNLEEKNIFIYDFTQDELLKSIDHLPSHHKSVFNLYYLENYSHAEISRMLQIPVNTSKSHLLRAKKHVQNYLMTHFVKKETTKNKTAQLLIFFGFGGLLWAHTFQNKFTNFNITPSRNLELPQDINHSQISVSKTANYWKQTVIIGSTVIIIIVGSVLIFTPKNTIFKSSAPQISNSEINGKIISAAKDRTADENKTRLPNLNNKNVENIQISQQLVEENHKDLNSERQLIKIKTATISKNKAQKDSAEAVHNKVIIVKKIVRRDTVFIERKTD